MLDFALAVFFLLITPGPGVLTTAGVAAAYGFRSGLKYVAGIVLGAQTVMIIVASGLWAMVATVPYVRETLVIASASYLLYLALKIAVSGSNIAFIEGQSPTFFDGYVLSLINPKAYAVGTVLFSGFPFWPDNIMVENGFKLAIQLAIAIPIHLIWLYAGAALKSLALSAGLTRAINYAMALAMVAVVVMAVASQIPEVSAVLRATVGLN